MVDEEQDSDLAVPGGYLYHTVPIRSSEDSRLFVTAAFHINDDLKISVDGQKAEELKVNF
jgi:hypothetical protein